MRLHTNKGFLLYLNLLILGIFSLLTFSGALKVDAATATDDDYTSAINGAPQ